MNNAVLFAIFLFAACRCPAATPILVYHRFAPAVNDSMTVTTRALDSQLAAIRDRGYHVISLRQLVDTLSRGGVLPPASLVITADDGHESIYTELLPRLERLRFPATLFIYPSAISNAKWAMTWAQLVELSQNQLFDIQSHTYWHPNFKTEQRRLSETAWSSFVATQLTKSRTVLEQKLSKNVDLLAWPFGIYDDRLIAAAQLAGYRAAFTLDRRSPAPGDRLLALPRYLMTDSMQGAAFEKFLAHATQDSHP